MGTVEGKWSMVVIGEGRGGGRVEGNVAGGGRERYGRADAGVAELADAQVLGACGEIRGGSSPSARIFLSGCGCGGGRRVFRVAVGGIFGIFGVSQRKRA